MRLLRNIFAMSAATASCAVAAEPSRIEKMVAERGRLCFARVYEPAHLKAHPQQRVQRLFFMIGKNKASAYWEDPNLRHSEESPNKYANPDARASDHDSTHVAALFTLRGMQKPENVSGWCFKPDTGVGGKATLQCGGECDRHIGGLRSDDGAHLVLDGVESGVLMDAEEDEASQTALRLGADDKSFRLDLRPIDECVAEANKANSPFMRLGAPLRERLKPEAPFCFGRDYSPEHLAAHPGQFATSVRISRDTKLIEVDRAKKFLPNWPDGASVVASVATRKNGIPVSMRYTCAPLEDQWECSANFCKSGAADCPQQDRENSKTAGCDADVSRTIYLRRGEKDFMMLGNPNMGLQLDAYCGPEKKTASDDRVYRLEPLPLSACEDR